MSNTTVKNVPFSLPLIDESVVAEVVDALTNTGWITSGPKVREFELAVAQYTGCPSTVAVNSWTSGAMVALRWFGVGPGDEVIVPAYTYCATALAAMNLGATAVMVDVDAPFHVSAKRIAEAITDRTKAIIPVDLGGLPCDYDEIRKLLSASEATSLFHPNCQRQEMLGRPLVISDAAHSLGAKFDNRHVGLLSDVTVFSFHSVKNLTTGEGGMICLNLPDPFDNENEQQTIRYLSLNGQTKSALEKSTVGGWKYDIVDQGFKANMPDICAAIGLAQIRMYEQKMLPERRALFCTYNDIFRDHEWAELPTMCDDMRNSSLHLYQLRIDGIREGQRNKMMRRMGEQGLGVNVHYVPLPMLTLFRNLGYSIDDFSNSFSFYENEITLPLYNTLSTEDAIRVAEAIVSARDAVVI